MLILALPQDWFDNHLYKDIPCATEFIYLHGIIERWNAYDMVAFVDDVPTTKGIYECTVLLGTNRYSPCKLYYWKDESKNRGLIVLETDTEANEYALSKYNEEAKFI